LLPDTPAYEAVLAAVGEGPPIGVPTAVLSEITYGISRFAGRNAALLDAQAWLGGLFDDGLLTALPLTASGAEVAGELRAERHVPPSGGPGRKSPKTERRVGWVLDLLIASTAWVHGYDIVTRNLRDFECIAELLPAPDEDSRLLVSEPAFAP